TRFPSPARAHRANADGRAGGFAVAALPARRSEHRASTVLGLAPAAARRRFAHFQRRPRRAGAVHVAQGNRRAGRGAFLRAAGRDTRRCAAARAAAAPRTRGGCSAQELLDRLDEVGVEHAFVTLHVGLGTFRPVTAETLEEHKMHAEAYTIPAATAEALNRA